MRGRTRPGRESNFELAATWVIVVPSREVGEAPGDPGRGPPTSGTKTRAEASVVFFGRILNFCNSLRWAWPFPVEPVDGFPGPGESVRGSRPPGERLGTGLTSSPTWVTGPPTSGLRNA